MKNASTNHSHLGIFALKEEFCGKTKIMLKYCQIPIKSKYLTFRLIAYSYSSSDSSKNYVLILFS